MFFSVFVSCIIILQPTQHIKVMLDQVNYPITLFLSKLMLTWLVLSVHTPYGPHCEKTVFGGSQTTQAQTRLRSLTSAFVIRFLESTIFKLATGEI